MKAVLMPALGVAMTEGLVLRWLKRPGDHVDEGEPIIEIETDKTAVEVPSPATGIVGPLLAAEGDVVLTGVALTHVSDGLEENATPADGSSSGAGASPSHRDVPVGAVVEGPSDAPALPTARAPHKLSPRERRLARERAGGRATARADGNAGSGTHGPSALPDVPPPVATAPQALPVPPTTGRYRSLIAARVAESWATIPHFSVTREVDAGGMMQVRATLDGTTRPSFTDLMLRALALALRETGEPDSADVGLAVATRNGVLIPVLRGVLQMDLATLRGEREAAVARARDDRLRPNDLGPPPRSTLSNLGTVGIDSFTGVIAVGQTSLLTVGRISPRPAAVQGGLQIRERFFATLNADHRALDGDHAARLLLAFASTIEDASRLAVRETSK